MFSDKCPCCQNKLTSFHFSTKWQCEICNRRYIMSFMFNNLIYESFEVDNYLLLNDFFNKYCEICSINELGLARLVTRVDMYIPPTISLQKLKTYLIII